MVGSGGLGVRKSKVQSLEDGSKTKVQPRPSQRREGAGHREGSSFKHGLLSKIDKIATERCCPESALSDQLFSQLKS